MQQSLTETWSGDADGPLACCGLLFCVCAAAAFAAAAFAAAVLVAATFAVPPVMEEFGSDSAALSPAEPGVLQRDVSSGRASLGHH